MNFLFGQNPLPKVMRIEVGSPGMQKACTTGLKRYIPTLGNEELEMECEDGDCSYRNLCKLLEKFGLPTEVIRTEIGNTLVCFPNGTTYLATGFDVGYLGSKPYNLACFGETAKFGECDELYLAIADIPKDFSGRIWCRQDQ